MQRELFDICGFTAGGVFRFLAIMIPSAFLHKLETVNDKIKRLRHYERPKEKGAEHLPGFAALI